MKRNRPTLILAALVLVALAWPAVAQPPSSNFIAHLDGRGGGASARHARDRSGHLSAEC